MVSPPVLERGRLLDLDGLLGVLELELTGFLGLTTGELFPDRNLRFISSIASSVGFVDPATLVRGLLVREELPVCWAAISDVSERR